MHDGVQSFLWSSAGADSVWAWSEAKYYQNHNGNRMEQQHCSSIECTALNPWIYYTFITL